ncbi:hypothetical protein ASPZODRAFT_20736 [Penicilliopsis zonata CBS 506.65]|uniref:Amine oxidase domain-containing protein n=1 Tax=Penicilliopsis zonata CBS 506.65 TaxID=1073090 RepID=A0A1L9S4P8_9EURO|nr:hypothetical protein ASPZODRAFT_20736 [Penicilliopsis zonata CBS 506.65]OJJ42138.1 hypothetical protein ASPZODRAFT_20736 [Penicilliopsis zonata CBS 506.65]
MEEAKNAGVFPFTPQKTDSRRVNVLTISGNLLEIQASCVKHGIELSRFFMTVWAIVFWQFSEKDWLCFGFSDLTRDRKTSVKARLDARTRLDSLLRGESLDPDAQSTNECNTAVLIVKDDSRDPAEWLANSDLSLVVDLGHPGSLQLVYRSSMLSDFESRSLVSTTSQAIASISDVPAVQISQLALASGLYDKSLSEAVLDAMDFEYPMRTGDSVQWYRVAGGTSRVIEEMERRISRKPELDTRVSSIAYEPQRDPSHPMSVHVDGEAHPRKYSAVFNSASLPCMRRMKMGPETLRPGQRAAIQSVHYDASTKIAIKIQCGQASTDLVIRTCVYPSPEGGQTCTVLLCSYTWAQDAQQMASLVQGDPDKLARLLRHNLALLHKDYMDGVHGRVFGYDKMLRIIEDEYEDLHAYDWYADPHASGAFAYFGPEQFRYFYPELVRPAAHGHMFLVGEACSAHHAWISGSLDSAYRGRCGGGLQEIPADVLEWQMYLTTWP